LGIWKDPLQHEPTPYEVLGVPRGAQKPEVERAVVAAIRRGVRSLEAQVARRALLTPAERASCDLLLYDPAVLERLNPSPLRDPTVLHASRRLATGEAWERQLRARFPDAGIAHSLGVLWYWWARHEQERLEALVGAAPDRARQSDGSKSQLILAARQKTGGACALKASECTEPDCVWREDCATAGVTAQEAWKRAVIYWSMLASTPEVWNGRLGLSEAESAALRKNFIEDLSNRLVDCAQHYSQQFAADHPLAASFRQLKLCLASELKTSAAMAQSGYRTKRGRVAAGVLMLQHLGLLEKVREQVDGLLERTPGNQALRELRALLSPHFPIIILVEEERAQEALEAIERLPGKDKESLEIRRLRCKALLIAGRQRASVNECARALDYWTQALNLGAGEDLDAEVRRQVVASCQSQGHELERRDADRAADILERGLRLTQDPKLRLQLAELLVGRGIDAFNKAQEAIKTARGAKARSLIKELERARHHIARAKELGSARAAANLETAEEILSGLKLQMSEGLLDLPEAAERPWREANAAVQRKDWDTAIERLREALKLAGGSRPGLTQRLASALANRGIQRANQAVQSLSVAHQAHGAELMGLIQEIQNHYDDDQCAICKKSKLFNTAGTEWFTVTLKGGKTGQLCLMCMMRLQQLQNDRPTPDPNSVALLRSGESDLAEASTLDPTSTHIQKNLRDVRETLRQLSSEPESHTTVERSQAPHPAAAPRPAPGPAPHRPRRPSPTPAPGSPPPAPTPGSAATPSVGVRFLKATWWLWAAGLGWLLVKGCQ